MFPHDPHIMYQTIRYEDTRKYKSLKMWNKIFKIPLELVISPLGYIKTYDFLKWKTEKKT